MEHLLSVENLKIGFHSDYGNHIYTDGISFHVDQGEILGIVGESGCGKSITSLSIMGLLGRNGEVTEGKVSLDGIDLLTLTEKKLDDIRGNEVAMIFQDALASLNPVFTIGNQLTEAIRKHQKLDKKEAKEEAIRALERAGLPEPESVMKKYPHTLSGGMRQRVMIAMALSCNPKLLIADEPTTALDVTIQAQIMRMIRGIREEYQMAVILITHDIGLVAEMADRVIVMYAGQMIEEADVYTLFKNPLHPYTQALLASAPSIMDDPKQELASIRGIVPENYMDITGCRFYDRCPYATERCKEKQKRFEAEKNHFVMCQRVESQSAKVDG